MISEYKYGERYFLEITNEMINSELPDQIKVMLGYPLSEVFYLKDTVMTKKELSNGNWGIAIQIAPYDNYIQPSTAVHNRLTKDQFELAKLYYGVDEFMTVDEYKILKIKTNEIDI